MIATWLVSAETEYLLIAQGFDRVQARRLAGRVEAKENPHSGRYAESQNHGLAGDDDRSLRQHIDQQRTPNAEGQPDQASDYRDHDGLQQELQQNVVFTGADRHTDANLPCSLGD